MNTNRITVSYPTRFAEFDVTPAEFDLIRSLYQPGVSQKVIAIKFLRQQYPMGLKEAKDICDAIGKSPARETF